MSIPHPQWQFWWSIWDSQIISYKNLLHIYKYIFKSTCSSQGLSSSLCPAGAGALRWPEGGRNWQASDQGSLPWDRGQSVCFQRMGRLAWSQNVYSVEVLAREPAHALPSLFESCFPKRVWNSSFLGEKTKMGRILMHSSVENWGFQSL